MKQLLVKLVGKLVWSVIERLPDEWAEKYWKTPCRTCGEDREWHLYGLFSSGRVFLDGPGVLSCSSLKYKPPT